MNKKPLTNKLSIYLIKQEYSSPQDIIKDRENLQNETIDDVGLFYYGDSYISEPLWVDKFFRFIFQQPSE